MNALAVFYESRVAKVRTSVMEDCIEVAKRIREQDKLEIWSSNHLSPIEACLMCFKKSTICLTITRNGFAVAMFGIVPINLLGNSASIWLITTNGITGMGTTFVRNNRMFIDYLLTLYPLLYGYVDIRNIVSMKWLQWLGARMEEPKPYGLDQNLCRYFYFEKE